MNPKLDIYSDLLIPFEVAAYCRGRKYSPQAVELARLLRTKEQAKKAMEEAERELLATEAKVALSVSSILETMTQEGAR